MEANATELPEMLQLEEVGEGRYRVPNEGDGDERDVLFGGQLLGQMIAAAAHNAPGKYVKSIHAIFARAGLAVNPTELQVEGIHAGRALGSFTITAWQGERLCARSLVLVSADEPDLISHQAPMPEVAGPDGWADHRDPLVFPGSQYRIVDDVDVYTVDSPVRPAQLHLWYRWPDAPEDRTVNQAALAWGTDGFLIGTAMLPHEGIRQDRAHRDISTGVVTHTLTFHQPFSMRDWLLMALESPFAGRGRTYGRANIFTADGKLVASYVQENLVRAFADGIPAEGQQRTIM